MKSIGIIPNSFKDREFRETREIISILREYNCSFYIPREAGEVLNLIDNSKDIEEIFEISDFVIVLGGDGTILEISHIASKYNTPLLGINLGTLGFLTNSDIHEAKEAIDNILKGNYKIENRIMLDVSVISNNGEINTYTALNDVYLTRGEVTKLVCLDVKINDDYVDTFRGDGLIVSTPTGSTAYNLSAGGAILKSDAEIMAITPICPHTLYARCIVLDARDIIGINPHGKQRGSIIISVDGIKVGYINELDSLKINRSKHYTRLIKTNKYGFYDVLREKMLRNGG